jgi:hypothetical protein
MASNLKQEEHSFRAKVVVSVQPLSKCNNNNNNNNNNNRQAHV